MTSAGTAQGETTLQERLAAFEGQPTGAPVVAPDPVNVPMIRHWVEAMGDENPVYLDDEVAKAVGFSGIVAPPTMLQAWIMRGYKLSAEADRARAEGRGLVDPSALDAVFALLDEAGFTSIVATNCEQDYLRPLVPGDRLSVRSVIESISPEKRTALGDGHFVTTRMDYSDQHGALVATMRFRVLRFRPGTVASGASTSAEPRPLRPRPAVTPDNAFFFEGARRGELLVQRCVACGVLRHPPRPACPECQSLEWDTVRSSGRGAVFSYVVVHHPQVPSFDYPLPIAVVELEEGTRLVADLIGIDPAEVTIGMPVMAEMVAVDDELTLPMFRPADGAR